MGNYVASEIIKLMIKNNITIMDSKVLILGITFKENCPDVRNTKVVDLVSALEDYGAKVDIHDPWAEEEVVFEEFGFKNSKLVPKKKFDAIVLSVSHTKFKDLDILSLKNKKSIVYDVKNFFENHFVDGRL
jgi:UDP-N-acetyl-D-galactosamine dehydrogenase